MGTRGISDVSVLTGAGLPFLVRMIAPVRTAVRAMVCAPNMVMVAPSMTSTAASTSPTRIAVAVVCRQQQVLVGQRSPDAPLAGMWEFPGGKLNSGESAEVAAVRECREETGLQIRVKETLATVQHQYAHGELELHFFRCELVADAPPTRPFRWVETSALGEMEFPEANREVLDILAAQA